MTKEKTTWREWFSLMQLVLDAEGIKVDRWVLRRLEENLLVLGFTPSSAPRTLQEAHHKLYVLGRAAKERWGSADEETQLAIKRVHAAVRCLKDALEHRTEEA